MDVQMLIHWVWEYGWCCGQDGRYFHHRPGGNSRSRESGVGLSIVRMIAEMHGGYVTAMQDRGMLMIRFRLPLLYRSAYRSGLGWEWEMNPRNERERQSE
jgi:hypothetical protein